MSKLFRDEWIQQVDNLKDSWIRLHTGEECKNFVRELDLYLCNLPYITATSIRFDKYFRSIYIEVYYNPEIVGMSCSDTEKCIFRKIHNVEDLLPFWSYTWTVLLDEDATCGDN